MSYVESMVMANLPETKRRLAEYAQRGLRGWSAILQLFKDNCNPKTAVSNCCRGEAYFNSLSEQEKSEVLSLAGIEDTTPRLFHSFNMIEREQIARTLRHLKLMTKNMPEHLTLKDFQQVRGSQE